MFYSATFLVFLQMISVPLISEEEGAFMLSGNTATQSQLLDMLNGAHSPSPLLLYVEGPHCIWVNKTAVPYFSLRLSSNDSRQFTESEEGKNLCTHVL